MPGYQAKFIHPLLKRHECPICLYAMRNPVQTECGHLFCKECLDPVLKRRRPICPLDKEEITQEGIFPDNACRREILNLDVYCNYVADGCQWVGHLKDLESHLESCEHREIQCIQCGHYIQAVSLKAHQEVECPMRPEKCAYCHQEVPSQQMEDHIKKVCPDVLHKCPHGCSLKLEMKLPELQRHLAEKGGDCPLSEVPCPYAIYGCSLSLRKNLSTHMDQYQLYHVQLQSESFMEMKSTMEKSVSTMQHLMERVGSLESRTNAIERLQDAIEQRVELLDERRERHLERYECNVINYSTVSSRYGTDVQPATSSHLLGLSGPVGGDSHVSPPLSGHHSPSNSHSHSAPCNQHIPEMHVRELSERVQSVIRAITDRGDVPWSDMKLAISFTQCPVLRRALDDCLQSGECQHTYESFVQLLFQAVKWLHYDSVLSLLYFLEALNDQIDIDLTQEIGLVDQLLEVLKLPASHYQEQDEEHRNLSFSPQHFHINHSPSLETMQNASSDEDLYHGPPNSSRTFSQRIEETFDGSRVDTLHLLGLSGPVGGEASPQRVDALQCRVVEVEHGVDRALSSCLDQELRIQLLERATYNGVLIWKIDEFERRRKEAIDGVTMSLYSTPFYTSRHGYKMCCRIYLNGDGLGKGTHLSFFFVIMRGPFDALLEWPFKQKVTLTLLNQSEKRSVTDSFRPDPQSSLFQRPLRQEMNIASGCPMFTKLSDLMCGGFVKDDCLYVRAVVDTPDLPK